MQCKCKKTVLQSNENVTQMQSSHPILCCNENANAIIQNATKCKLNATIPPNTVQECNENAKNTTKMHSSHPILYCNLMKMKKPKYKENASNDNAIIRPHTALQCYEKAIIMQCFLRAFLILQF